MAEPITARFESVCPACQERISPGQLIERWGAGFRHSGCIAVSGSRPSMSAEEHLEWEQRQDEARRDEELVARAMRRVVGRVDPSDFDFPCSRVWRCGYSGEPYEPEAEEVRRPERLEGDMRRIAWAANTDNPYRAALAASLKRR